MKIAFIVASRANKGPVLVAKDLANYFLADGHDVHLYYFDDTLEVKFNCKCYKIRFIKTYDFSKYDIIHSHSLRPDLYNGLRIRNIQGIKITTLHNYFYQDLKMQYGLLRTYLAGLFWFLSLQRLDRIVCLSNNMKDYYSDLLPKRKLSYIYNGKAIDDKNISIEHINLISELKTNYVVIGVVALLIKRKGIHQLVEAISNDNRFALVIVGDGPEKEKLERLCKSKRLTDRCFFLGFQNNGHRYFKYFSIFAMTSYSEGFPLSLLEASYSGTPTVCIDSSLFRELFPKEVVFFKENDVNSLLKSLIEISENKVMYSDLIYHKAQSDYTVRHMRNKYLDLYKSAIENR